MAKLTIAQLTAQREAAHVAYQALDQRAAALAADNAALKQALAEAEAKAKSPRRVVPQRREVPQRPVDPARDAAHTAYVARAAAARAEAMRTGKSVLVKAL